MVKFILVSGGVVSGVGKGLTASSIGVLLKCCGWNVTAVKLDPYLNADGAPASRFSCHRASPPRARARVVTRVCCRSVQPAG